MKRIILAFLVTTALSGPLLAEDFPSSEEKARKLRKLEVAPTSPATAIAPQPVAPTPQQPIVVQPLFTAGQGSKKLVLSFNQRPAIASINRSGNIVTIRMRGAASFNNTTVRAGYADAFSSIKRLSGEGDNLAIQVQVPAGREIRTSTSGSMVVVESVAPTTKPPVVEEKKLEEKKEIKPAAKTQFVPKPAAKPIAAEKKVAAPIIKKEEPKPEIKKVEPKIIEKPAPVVKPVPEVKKELPATVKVQPEKEVKPAVKVEEPKPEPVKPVPEIKKEEPKIKAVKPLPEVKKVEVIKPAPEVKKEEPKAVAEQEVKKIVKVEVPKKEEAKLVVKPATPVVANRATVAFEKEGSIERLRFTFSRPVATALFVRFGYYWLVLDTDDAIELPAELSTSTLFAAPKKITAMKTELASAENYTPPATAPAIFVFPLSQTVHAMAERNGNEWLFEFDSEVDYEETSPLLMAEDNTSWTIGAKGLGDRIVAKDEFTNDLITIFPLSEDGFIGDETYTDNFVAEPTVQGVVLKPIEVLSYDPAAKDSVKILKSATTSGVVDAENVTVPEKNSGLKPLIVFDAPEILKPDDFRKREQKLKNSDRYAFGKFLFNQGLYPEAAVNLEGVKGFDAAFLTGVSHYMAGKYFDALKVFTTVNIPANGDANELLLWQAAANHELYSLYPADSKEVSLANFTQPKNLGVYPDEIKKRVLFPLIEQLVDESRADDAQAYLNLLPKKLTTEGDESYRQYLQGRIYAAKNMKARSRELWDKVAKSNTDRESRAKSTFEIIIQDYKGGKIKTEEAIKQINDIRILWRGDMFEYNMLMELADMYVSSKQEYEALRTYKEILTSFSNFPKNVEIAKRMREIYETAIDKEFANKENTFRAVTLYYEFEELKPVGAKGDQITLQLADSLARYDLLDEAAKVLTKFSTSLTDDAQKSEIGTRIAILNYLNNKPKEALAALEESQVENPPAYLVQERKILEIRALIDMGDLDKADSKLAAVSEDQANRFRADILWKRKKWGEMIGIYDLVKDKSDEDIMRMAIAYVLVDDKLSTAKMKKDYAKRMSAGQYAESFEFISDPETIDYRNLTDTLKLDQAEGMVQKYRGRLQQSGLEGVTGKPAEAKPETKPVPENAEAPKEEETKPKTD